jgi:hypothetical protein
MQTVLQHRSNAWTRKVAGVVLAVASLSAVLVPATAQAQSEVSLAVSALPIASIAVVAGSAVAAYDNQPSTAPLVSAQVAMSLTVMAIETLADGTVYLLQRASDGARFSVKLATQGVGAVSLAVGAVVTTSTMATGMVLSAAGEAVAFIPNAVGQALLHHEKL